MSTHPAGRRAAVKAGCNPVHFSLDGCPLSCYFSGSVATTSGHFVHKSERRTRDGAIRPVLRWRKQTCACGSIATTSTALFSCRFKCPLPSPAANGIFTATPTERITHYTLLRKVRPNGGRCSPFEISQEKGGTLLLHGAHTAFLLSSLRLYRLSKSQRGIDVVSLTLGNSGFPSDTVLPETFNISANCSCVMPFFFAKFF